MARPTLAFVDHSFHRKTHSSDFLRELFRETFEVHEYWDESWQGGPSVPPALINTHDYVFYLQVLNPVSELKQIRVPILWAPMYDGFTFTYSYFKILENLDLKILSFSERITELLSPFSIPVMNVHYYYLESEKTRDIIPGNHIFFWYRGGIDFNLLRRILDPKQIDSFTILEVPDKEGAKILLSPEDIKEYKITYLIEEFLSRERYLELVRKSSIFIAPRKKEGIGAFTEALVLGKCVIAYNDAVHNEYITDGVDGLLFTQQTQMLDLSHTQQMAESTWIRAIKGHATWVADKPRISEFFRTPVQQRRSDSVLTFWQSMYFATTKIRALRYHLKRLLNPARYV